MKKQSHDALRLKFKYKFFVFNLKETLKAGERCSMWCCSPLKLKIII
jgi:hypothetical protein